MTGSKSSGSEGCANCETDSAATPGLPFVYVAGRIRPHFPSLGIEREFSHALGDTLPHGGPDASTLYKILSEPENEYIARKMCWIFDLDGIDSFAPYCDYRPRADGPGRRRRARAITRAMATRPRAITTAG